jgi:hypothetical protein
VGEEEEERERERGRERERNGGQLVEDIYDGQFLPSHSGE